MSGFVQSGRFGGAATNPLDALTWAFRFESSSITGLADLDAVATWTDTSGNTRNATQATGANQPTYRTGILNGEPAVRFGNGTDQRLVTAAITAIAQPHTVFIVCSFAAAGRTILDGAAGGAGRVYIGTGSGTTYELYAGASVYPGDATPYSTVRILQLAANGASSKWRVNGGAATTLDPGTSACDGLTLGNRFSGLQSIGGDAFSILVAPSNLSLADLDTVGNYLASKYALTWSAAS